MATSTIVKKENASSKNLGKREASQAGETIPKPLSRKAQEAKIFLENNPIPKEFLKS